MAIPAFRRRAADIAAFLFATAATVFGLVWLAWILWVTIQQGAAALSPQLFKEMTPPPGESGGLLNAFYGSAVMIFLGRWPSARRSELLQEPILPSTGATRKLAAIVSFVNDILLKVRPRSSSVCSSILLGESFARRDIFSGYAGALALAMILLLPIVVRTTEEALRLIPDTMREAGFALGLPRWRVTRQILYKAGLSAILTGILLGVARDAGGDCSAPLHRAQQPVLELEPQRAARQCPGGDIPICNEPLRRVAHARLGRRVRAHCAFVLILNILVRLLARKGKQR